MSAIGIAHQSSFAARPRIISAHADHRPTDFMFSRMQSRTMRDAPWGRRIQPMRSWGEIGGYAAVLTIGTALACAFI